MLKKIFKLKKGIVIHTPVIFSPEDKSESEYILVTDSGFVKFYATMEPSKEDFECHAASAEKSPLFWIHRNINVCDF